MNHTRAVLRRAAAERQMKGSSHARDAAIERFLGELSTLFTPKLIVSLRDDVIASIYEDWLRSLKTMSEEQRTEALIADIRLSKVPFLAYNLSNGKADQSAVQDDPPNVVSLHAR